MLAYLGAFLFILYCAAQSLPSPLDVAASSQTSTESDLTAYIPNPKVTLQSQSFIAPPTDQTAAAPNAAEKLFLPLLVRAAGTLVPTATATAINPTATRTATLGPSTGEWSQHAHDAQHTGYTDQVVAAPWRWKWVWNGANASGGIATGKFGLPRNSQPVTGGGRVYIAAGGNGVYALNSANGSPLWNTRPGGNINSTPAYDSGTNAVFVLSSNGTLYKLDAATGNTSGQFATGGSSTLPLPPSVLSDRVLISMGTKVYAINKTTMAQLWAYDAGSAVHTPPAYSPSRNRVIAISEDLMVHAINNANGTRVWSIKPTPLTAGDPGQDSNSAESKYGWPVIAEAHGLVLVRYRLDWQTLWTWNPWPSTNSAMRANLTNRPDQQAIFALSLDTGASAFIANVGNGGYGDGGYIPMGPQPVVKRFANGQEVAYIVMRGAPCDASPCDGRWDSHLGEMELDSTTVSGYQAGDVRYIRNTFFPTDEQANLSMSGDYLLGGHWMFGLAHAITDRSASRGTSSNRIQTTDLPHIITSASNCGFSASHYCGSSLIQDGDPRTIPGGFYIYYNQGTVYDRYWSEYASWVVSNGIVYFVSADGAIVALESGAPAAPVANTLFAPATTTPAAMKLAQAMLNVNDTPSVIPYTDARRYAGQTATVEGTLQFVFNNGVAAYLGFKNPHQGEFKARVLKENWNNFDAPPETLFQVGQRVRVTGTIEWYQGDPVIYVRVPAQVQIVGP
ncbi:MAG: PQQ-like beta-propeller repeat protein [Chloroflexi bacterium]|nr:PQQ-like beta-propeller repeat protein [Chloroflexota bacterium]